MSHPLLQMKFAALATAALIGLLPSPALADDTAELLKEMREMRAQIRSLQQQVNDLRAEKAKTQELSAHSAAATAATPVSQEQVQGLQQQVNALKAQQAKAQEPLSSPAAVPPPTVSATPTAALPPPSADGTGQVYNNGKVKVAMGGFSEVTGIYRTRNETADVASNWNTGIPYPYQAGYHMGEFRGSARQSRFSIQAEGKPYNDVKIGSYMEFDFLGAANTANSNESNSYTPRIRQFYATADWADSGWHLLGGQAWSLLTLYAGGLTPGKENRLPTIDAQYVPGFTWTRNVQVRAVKDLDKNIWAGLSLESPQALINAGPNVSTACTNSSCFLMPGGSGFTTATSYSTDIAPDVIAKLAFEPGWGHYEIYGLGRTFYDRTMGRNKATYGGGVGVGAIIPIIDKKLEFQVSGLYGNGVGRYGSVQLPDVTVKPDGSLATLKGLEMLAGIVGHPREDWDVYLYTGEERVSRQAYGTANGYGNLNYNNSGCNLSTGTAATCVADTSAVGQITVGAWYSFYRGSYGTMKAGVSDAYTERNIFGGVGGNPSTNDNTTMVSFRYYPF